MKILGIISRIFTGLVFTFSGFVKAIDPLGSTYKFTDYFTDAFHLPGLEPFSFPLAIIMSAAEMAIGLMLLFNFKHKWATWGAILLMLVFTPLTLYLAIANPVHDCGCFGDALVLSNWQTFWKNIIINAFIVALYITRNKMESRWKPKIQYIGIIAIFAISFLFEFYNYRYLPMIDFRPYKVGTNIPEKMAIPEGVEQDEYETTLIYENSETSEIKEFTMENYPWEDSTWVWLETKSVLIKEGYKPPIQNFSLIDVETTEDLTDRMLEAEKPVLLVITYDLTKTNLKGLEKTYKKILEYSQNKEYETYCLTASLKDEIDSIAKIVSPPENMKFCNTDEITLKTIVRANPGLLLLEKGIIKGKWTHHALPKKIDK